MELGRSNLTRRYSYQQELRPCAESVSLGGGWEGHCPSLNFSKLSVLSETSQARKLMFGLHVNIDKKNSRRYDDTW